MMEAGERRVIVKGGKGGLGNSNFKSSINRAPERATPGEEGEEFWIWLKLKLISDAGLLGLPNAGKSTFLASTTRAKPKIADYPFTTLKPQLGVVYIDQAEFVLADIPGLIEGASEGKGLGDRFLKHVERCGILIHLLDGFDDNLVENYKTIRLELANYSQKLASKKEIIAINKIDVMLKKDLSEKIKALEKTIEKDQKIKPKIFPISAITKEGVEDLLREVYQEIIKYREEEQ